MSTLGLYIHIPFCRSKCRYCDFCSFPHPKKETVQAYVRALITEIGDRGQEMRAIHGENPSVDTVFFGGGTPTCLPIRLFGEIMEAVTHSFSLSTTAEITAECNPATADRDYLRALRGFGINRLSIGAQSMNDNELRLLGRLHTANDFLRTFSDARDVGFENLSADVMFGIPEQTTESLETTLARITALDPEHISVYGLQIEDGTYFVKYQSRLALPDEETERQMYMNTVNFLAARGLPRYEISNFARPGAASRHNLKYWQRDDYLGLGIAAHSCLGSKRFSNTSSLAAYMAGDRVEEQTKISDHDVLCETVMLGMRLERGIDFAALAQKYGPRALAYRDALAKYTHGGFLKQNGDTLSFTDAGMYVSNTILADVLDFDD